MIILEILTFALDQRNFEIKMLELNEDFIKNAKRLNEFLEKIKEEKTKIENKTKDSKEKNVIKTKAKSKVKKEAKNEEHTTN